MPINVYTQAWHMFGDKAGGITQDVILIKQLNNTETESKMNMIYESFMRRMQCKLLNSQYSGRQTSDIIF